jgi:GNAT superfamily N-acetyltransferase
VATAADTVYSEEICAEMARSAEVRGTGIARREPTDVSEKMRKGMAVIALADDGRWAGFCYVQAWSEGRFTSNSGLIVAPAFRNAGLARQIKRMAFQLARELDPHAHVFGLTTGLAVMKINSELGYQPVTYSEISQDDAFWAGCESCVNHAILISKNRKNCLCTAMRFDAPPLPESEPVESGIKEAPEATTDAGPQAAQQAERRTRRKDVRRNLPLFERWMRLKRSLMLGPIIIRKK